MKSVRLYVRNHPDEPVGPDDLRDVHPASPKEVLSHPAVQALRVELESVAHEHNNACEEIRDRADCERSLTERVLEDCDSLDKANAEVERLKGLVRRAACLLRLADRREDLSFEGGVRFDLAQACWFVEADLASLTFDEALGSLESMEDLGKKREDGRDQPT